MRLTNIGKFSKMEDFVSWKLEEFSKEQKNFENLFNYMFSESDNIMAEFSDGYRIKKLTYGEVKGMVCKKAAALDEMLDLPKGSMVGLYMDNSLDWILVFWSILMCGYRPLLMNMRLSEVFLEQVLAEHSVGAVISDEKCFCVKTVLNKDIVQAKNEKSGGVWGKEVIFMSSGTSDRIKLCAYSAENFYYQVANSVEIVKKSPEIANHYKGELKQLTLLPFYHVFGFIAVYLWFGFFSRTFVFLKNLNPKTIQNTVKKHKVTHLFAVPLVWEAVYKAADRSIKGRGDKTYTKFKKGINLANKSSLGAKLTHKSMGEVRENLFGDSIQFLISGGGAISNEALEFFNGIGYHLCNGFGMTEVGIASVEMSNKAKQRIKGSIGAPFKYNEYKIDDSGALLVRGKNMASRIYCDGEEMFTNTNEWFNSKDICEIADGSYYLCGRQSDLIVSSSGENINPQLVEGALKIPGAEGVCLVEADGVPTLLVKSSACYSEEKVRSLMESAKAGLCELSLESEVKNIVITPESFIKSDEFKLNRKKVAARLSKGEMVTIGGASVKEKIEQLVGELENSVRDIFAQILNKEACEIGGDMSFFTDLGGSSLDYFMLSDNISAKYGVDIKAANGKSLATVNDICEFIRQQ